MNTPKFHSYPKEWGMQLHYTGNHVPLDSGDLGLLDRLREHFKEEEGAILSWKFDLSPIQNLFPALLQVLHRLWANGFVTKFSSQFHTVHGNPEYIKWYIWEEMDERDNTERHDTRAPGYIV